MAKMNKAIVRIMDQEYTIRSEDSREFIQKVANYVDDKMHELKESNNKLSTSALSILTAINIADDYLKINDIKQIAQKLPPIDEQRFNSVIQSLSDDIEKKDKKISELEKLLSMAEDKLQAQNQRMKELESTLSEKESEILQGKDDIRLKDELLLIRADECEQVKKQNENLSMELHAVKEELKEFINTFDDKDDLQITLIE